MPYSDMATEIAPESGLRVSTATGHELYRVGLCYSEGVGVNRDRIAAHKWFNLAVMKGSEEAKTLRSEIAAMLSQEEIKSALQAARAWLKLAN